MPSLQEIMAKAKRERIRVNELVTDGERALAFESRESGWVTVTRDASKPGRWRATMIDATGEPYGHLESADFEGALLAARDVGADLTRDPTEIRGL
jgi:hypothetical protein